MQIASIPRRFAFAGCAAIMLAALAMPSHAVMPTAWKTTNYALAPGEARVRDVLGDLQKTMGLSIEMTQAVQGSISSAGEAMTVEGLLNKIAVNNGLNWFVFRNRLYVARESEVEEARLPAPSDQVGELRSYLSGLRLLEDKFGWIEMASRSEVTVIGPPAYVRLVRQHAANVKLVKPKEPVPLEPMQTMTFRLRHASAIDVQSTGGARMIPGVASMLRKLYGDDGTPESLMAGDRSATSPIQRRQRREAAQASASRSGPDVAALRNATADSGVEDETQAAEPSIPAFPVRMRALASDLGNPGSGPESRKPTDAAGFTSAAQWRHDGFGRNQGGMDERPSIQADARLNMILVRDRASKRAEYERLIAELDVATLQFGLNAVVLELDTDAMGVLLTDVARSTRPGPLASSVVVSRTAIEALYPALRAARQCKQDISLVSQSVVFKENDAFGLNFADDLIYPSISTPFWYSLFSKLVALPQDQANKARTIGLKLVGSARATGDQRVELRFELTDGRDNPLDRGELVSKRLTETSMSIELAEDDVLLLVDGLVWSGNDMKTARSRMVMLSTRRWSREDAPRQLAAAAALAPAIGDKAPACAASGSARASMPPYGRSQLAAAPAPAPAPAPAMAVVPASSVAIPARTLSLFPRPAYTRGAPMPTAPDAYAR
ncbi:secretin N-terminal domain-containing protein [Variovorax sp. RHLX14]|uniref:secretin N-terminal domain-containing protein n=1 Tax=Variovorax sp. RHLX14 TaxID=1259731 RepID=UPI003F462307